MNPRGEHVTRTDRRPLGQWWNINTKCKGCLSLHDLYKNCLDLLTMVLIVHDHPQTRPNLCSVRLQSARQFHSSLCVHPLAPPHCVSIPFQLRQFRPKTQRLPRHLCCQWNSLWCKNGECISLYRRCSPSLLYASMHQSNSTYPDSYNGVAMPWEIYMKGIELIWSQSPILFPCLHQIIARKLFLLSFMMQQNTWPLGHEMSPPHHFIPLDVCVKLYQK